MAKSVSKYLFLLRHGSVDRSSGRPDNENGLSETGIKEVKEVASAASDFLRFGPSEKRIHINHIFCSAYRVCNECAQVYAGFFNLNADKLTIKEGLTPENYYSDRKKTLEALASEISSALNSDNSGLLVIGHEPQMGWIAEKILGSRKGTNLLLTRAELACMEIRFKDNGEYDSQKSNLLWTIAPSDPDILNTITQKIKSKMDLAKTFGSVITFLLGFALSALIDESKINFLKGLGKQGELRELIYLFGGLFKGFAFQNQHLFYYLFIGSIGFLFISLLLYLSTMSSYDRLLMPARFWASSLSDRPPPKWLVMRPPSSSARILFLNMMHVWNRLFIPATQVMIAALFGIAFVIFHFNLPDYLLLIGIGYVVYAQYQKIARPRLGADD